MRPGRGGFRGPALRLRPQHVQPRVQGKHEEVLRRHVGQAAGAGQGDAGQRVDGRGAADLHRLWLLRGSGPLRDVLSEVFRRRPRGGARRVQEEVRGDSRN